MQKFKINVVDSFGNNSSIEFDTNEKALEYLQSNNLESDITVFEEDCCSIPSKMYKLTGSYFMSDTIDVNYNIKCIKASPIIDDDGFRTVQDYHFFNVDSQGKYILTDLVVRENFSFFVDSKNEVETRLLQVSMANEDGDLVLVKERPKFYNDIEKMTEKKERKQNLVNKVFQYLKDNVTANNLDSTIYDSIVSNTVINVDIYVKGDKTLLLSYFTDNINLTVEQKTVILGILDR